MFCIISILAYFASVKKLLVLADFVHWLSGFREVMSVLVFDRFVVVIRYEASHSVLAKVLDIQEDLVSVY